jgi:hypothetical protein
MLQQIMFSCKHMLDHLACGQNLPRCSCAWISGIKAASFLSHLTSVELQMLSNVRPRVPRAVIKSKIIAHACVVFDTRDTANGWRQRGELMQLTVDLTTLAQTVAVASGGRYICAASSQKGTVM